MDTDFLGCVLIIVVIIIFFGIAWLVMVVSSAIDSRRNRSLSQRPPQSYRPPSTLPVVPKRDTLTYRPSTSIQKSIQPVIEFKNISGSVIPIDFDIKDLVDALTGAPLTLALDLYQCQRCKVFYQLHSVEVIKSENGGRCVSCQHAEIVNVAGRREQR